MLTRAAASPTSPVLATEAAVYATLHMRLPGRPLENIGVFLLHGDRLLLRLRRDWLYVAGPDHFEYLDALEQDLRGQLSAYEKDGRPAEEFFAFLENNLSNFLEFSERQPVLLAATAERTLKLLYEREVRPEVRRFETHLPLFSLRAAATKFGPHAEADLDPEDWVEAPADLRLTSDLFVARIVGKSMEPRIPDESLAIFRAGVKGSRQGKIVLVELYDPASGVQYTIKRYTSQKTAHPDGGWSHAEIRLEPLNPDFEAFTLREDSQVHVIAEFIGLLAE